VVGLSTVVDETADLDLLGRLADGVEVGSSSVDEQTKVEAFVVNSTGFDILTIEFDKTTTGVADSVTSEAIEVKDVDLDLFKGLTASDSKNDVDEIEVVGKVANLDLLDF